MRPKNFAGQNLVFAKDQPEYLPLPAHRDINGTVVTCWHLNWRERFKILLSGEIWFSQLTFNFPLQPQLPSAEKPEITEQ